MTQPKTASVAIIGGGVVGCSIAYHLARRGLPDVVVLERETVGSGTTSKAAGGIRAQFPTETEIRFSLESLKVLKNFTEEFGVDPGFKQIGYLFLISEEENLRGFERRIALQRSLGVDVRVITPKEAQAVHMFLRSILKKILGVTKAEQIPLLYGGSVNEKNAVEFMQCSEINGVLVGGASLSCQRFLSLVDGGAVI